MGAERGLSSSLGRRLPLAEEALDVLCYRPRHKRTREVTHLADAVLIVTANGRGKLVNPDEYPVRGRGGKGVRSWGDMAESGPIAAVAHVHTQCDEKVLIVTAQGQALMLKVDDVAARSRSAGGVRVMERAPGDTVVSATV